jgi:hypothetical protein
MTSEAPTIHGRIPRSVEPSGVTSRFQAPRAADAIPGTYSVFSADTSSGTIAGVYAIFLGQFAPTDLVSELIWSRRGYNLKTLARSFLIPRRALMPEIAKLNSMRHADAGWDGYRAQKPNARTIDFAISFLRQLSKTEIPLPAATVSSSGNAALFDSNENYYLDIEFEPDRRIGWLVQLRGGKELEDYEPFDEGALPPHLTALLRSAYND